ncbi:MAG: DUF1858 domain-containing protein [Epsilonproteobacteria bacterium]|nr:DUF1858 domain-containing protein [Campylobacterota bacterium]
MKEITLQTTIAELLNDYEGMKDILIGINPKFKKLNNPILRRTLAKVATVKQAAFVGGMEPLELLNALRKAVGQSQIDEKVEKVKEPSSELPSWYETPQATFDANKLLAEDKNPLAEVVNTLKNLKTGAIVELQADFWPEPLIEELEKKGFLVHCQKVDEKLFKTFIKKVL